MDKPKWQLSPILRHIGACDRSLIWLSGQRFGTFREAYEAACIDDVRWLAGELTARDFIPRAFFHEVNEASFNAYYRVGPNMERAVWHSKLPWHIVEKALVKYAQHNNCLREVS